MIPKITVNVTEPLYGILVDATCFYCVSIKYKMQYEHF